MNHPFCWNVVSIQVAFEFGSVAIFSVAVMSLLCESSMLSNAVAQESTVNAQESTVDSLKIRMSS